MDRRVHGGHGTGVAIGVDRVFLGGTVATAVLMHVHDVDLEERWRVVDPSTAPLDEVSADESGCAKIRGWRLRIDAETMRKDRAPGVVSHIR